MIKRLLLAVILAWTAPAFAQQSPAGLGAEIEKGVAAYNAQDLKYYESHLDPDVTYIADDGATFVGRERVLGLFGRLFAATPKRQMAVSDIVMGGQSDFGWARFKWTITRGDATRNGIASVVMTRSAEGWRAVLIQNTPEGHAPTGHH